MSHIKSAMGMIAGNAVYAISQWAILAIIARIGGATEVGRYALALAITAPLFTLANLGLRQVLATDMNQQATVSVYFRTRVVTTVLALVVSMVILGIMQPQAATAWIIALLALAKAVEGFSDLTYGVFQKRQQLNRVALSMGIRGVGAAAAIAVGVVLSEGSAAAGVALIVAVWVLILVFHDLRLANEIDHGMRGQRNGAQPGVFTLVGTALPLGLTTALIIFNTNIPRYFLQYQFDSQALGIFSVMAYFVVAGAWLVQALGQTIIARLAVSFAANDRAVFLRLSGLYSGLALTFGLAGMLLALFWGDPVIELLYGPEFAGHSQTFIVIMAAGLFFYVEAILTVAITAMRRFRMVMIPQIASLVLSLIGSVFLIPEYGILGAGLVLLLIAIARFGVSAAILVWGISQFGARGRQLSGRP